jgi:ATP-binding cassette subfamily F protein 3
MLIIDDLVLSIAGRRLVDGASARIPGGARVGLVGRNGTGKTSLFRAIIGELAPESGTLEIPARWTIGRLSQEAPEGPDSLLDTVLKADTERARLLAEAESAADPHRIADIQTRLADIGAHSAPARAATILAGLGFSHADQQRPCSEFSGGWRMRVALASVLFAQSDLLLLDEPTNYLDLEGTLWLEDHLAQYPRTLLIISHDRDLLDKAVDNILHLERGNLTFYRGGYSGFERQRRERQMLDSKAAAKQELERKRLQAFVDRFRATASKARQAQSRMKMLAKLEPIAVSGADDVPRIEFPAPAKQLSPPIIALDGVSVGYVDERPILSNLSLRIDPDDRIALLGANGNGKSTLAKLLADRLTPIEGSVTRAEKLSIGYFAQHQLDELQEGHTPYQHIRQLMPDAPEAKVRARAGSIGFSGTAADKLVGNLSGGEKARLLIGLTTLQAPHLVILDEPTNHLDIDARAALIETINGYSGAVILVSHDRYLLEACADRLWLVAGGKVSTFDGDLEDYRRLVLRGNDARASDEPVIQAANASADRAELRRNAARMRAELAPLKRRIGEAEKAMARLHAEIARLDAALANGLFARDPARASALAKERSQAVIALAEAEENWLAASSAYESQMA